MSSPDEPGLRRRRRRGRRAAAAGRLVDPNRATGGPIDAGDESGTARPAEPSPDQDGAGTTSRTGTAGPAGTTSRTGTTSRAGTGRRGRPAKSAGRRSGTAGAAEPAKSAGRRSGTAGAAEPANRSRQPNGPSARTIRETERGWRDLAGNGASQLGVSGALRARDVARPGPAELAEAERSVQLVRRQWQPPAAD